MNRNAFLLPVLTALALFCCLWPPPSPLAAERAGGIQRGALPEGIRNLPIEDGYVSSDARRAGVIEALEGDVLVFRRASQRGYLGSRGDPVHENDVFFTLPKSRCRLRFVNRDVVRLAPRSILGVDSCSLHKEKGEKWSLFTMLKGQALFYAVKLMSVQKAHFEVRTPTAFMSTRAAKFGARVYRTEDRRARMRTIRVADSGRGLAPLMLARVQATSPGPVPPIGEGAPVTVGACGVGTVNVQMDGSDTGTGTDDQPPPPLPFGGSLPSLGSYTPGNPFAIPDPSDAPGPTAPGVPDPGGFTIGPGQFFNTHTGEVGYDPSVLPKIQTITIVGTGEDVLDTITVGVGIIGIGAIPAGGVVTAPGAGGSAEGGDLLVDVTSTQTGAGTQTGVGDPNEPELSRYGYFATLLRTGGSETFKDLFLTAAANDFDGGSDHQASSMVTAGGLNWEGTTYAEGGGYPYIRTGGFEGDPGTTLTAVPVSEGLGYEHLSYGRWAHETSSVDFLDNNAFVDHAWWLEGMSSPQEIMDRQTGCFAYTGDACGTMYVGADKSSYRLSGTFRAEMNFDNRTVEDFHLNVSDGAGHGASIAGEAGGVIRADGTFDVTGGDWKLEIPGNSLDPDRKEAHGRFFGPDADETGGDWGMSDSGGAGIGAAGVWAGQRQD